MRSRGKHNPIFVARGASTATRWLSISDGCLAAGIGGSILVVVMVKCSTLIHMPDTYVHISMYLGIGNFVFKTIVFAALLWVLKNGNKAS